MMSRMIKVMMVGVCIVGATSDSPLMMWCSISKAVG